jgi:hypothetical protein
MAVLLPGSSHHAARFANKGFRQLSPRGPFSELLENSLVLQ